ncbi:MAG TPA: hypothetical protein VFB12_16370 [Ktedonobacteraceae bacterium]|nr:hypothetical protein [Ktedonobacteraceae bacterium]
MMKVYPCGYSVYGALIDSLIRETPHLLLIDTRQSPRSRIAGWSQAALERRFGQRYRWAGRYLGNVNYANAGPIKLADPVTGIRGLIRYLREGYDLILLCGCREYEQCHLRVIVELLCQHLPAVEIIHPEMLQAPEMVKCLSVRQPFAWLLTHPDVLAGCGIEPKCIENRDWSTRYRGPLLIHAGSQVDREMFNEDRTLDRAYWAYKFGVAGEALAETMPQTQQEYATKAIVGMAELVDVVQCGTSPWFVGQYGLVLQHAHPIEPVLNYPGRLMVFDVPRSAVAQALEQECNAESKVRNR